MMRRPIWSLSTQEVGEKREKEMTDYAPEFNLGEPTGDYKAVSCWLASASAAVAKGDWVTLVSTSSTDPCPTVTASVTGDYAYGIVMKAGSPSTLIGVVTLGIVKTTAWGSINAGASVLPHGQSAVYSVTAKTGVAKALMALACGDTGLVYIFGGVV
jgi:hypothetical protein